MIYADFERPNFRLELLARPSKATQRDRESTQPGLNATEASLVARLEGQAAGSTEILTRLYFEQLLKELYLCVLNKCVCDFSLTPNV